MAFPNSSTRPPHPSRDGQLLQLVNCLSFERKSLAQEIRIEYAIIFTQLLQITHLLTSYFSDLLAPLVSAPPGAVCPYYCAKAAAASSLTFDFFRPILLRACCLRLLSLPHPLCGVYLAYIDP